MLPQSTGIFFFSATGGTHNRFGLCRSGPGPLQNGGFGLRRIAMALMKRIHSNYRFVMGFNGTLIALGVLGILPPATSAMLHNISTLGVSLQSMSGLTSQLPSVQQKAEKE